MTSIDTRHGLGRGAVGGAVSECNQSEFGAPIAWRLAQIDNWPELASTVQYSVDALAKVCGVSVRTLQKYFATCMGEPPRQLLKRLRMERAQRLLHSGSNVDQTAFILGYDHRSPFSREFKRFYGFPPIKARQRAGRHTPTPPGSHLVTK